MPGPPSLAARARRALPAAAALLAIAVALPALNEPASTDDLVLCERLTDPRALGPPHYGRDLVPPGSQGLPHALARLFDWVGPGHAVEAPALIASGVYPWWAAEGFLLAFWRPLSSLTHWLDYRLWPDSLRLIHLHGILWFAAAAAAVAALFRRLLPPPAAALAAGLWVLDRSFFFPVAWMAGRNNLLCVTFGALALAAHDAWRRQGHRGAAWLAPALYAASLAAGEPGIGTAAYLVAHAACLDPAPWRARIASLAPAAAVTAAWRLAYLAMGFGAEKTGLYLDPGREPLRFLAAAAERAPLLVAAQVGGPRADLYEYLAPGAKPLFWATAAGLVALAAWLARPLLASRPTARFAAAGLVLSVLPICAASPVTDRRLLFAGWGGMALAAAFIAGVASGEDWVPRRRRERWIARGGAVAAALALAALPAADAVARWGRRPPAGVHPYLAVGDDPGLAAETLILVNVPHPFLTVYLPWERRQAGSPVPRAVRMLAPAFRTIEVRRPAPGELVLTGLDGALMTVERQTPAPAAAGAWRWRPPHDPAHDVYGLVWSNEAFWSGSFPLAPGEVRRLPEFTVEVLVAEAGLPSAVRFSFDGPLEARGRRWLAWSWRERRYLPFSVPAVGEAVRVPGPFR